jgi:PAS domain S-box-containing protein
MVLWWGPELRFLHNDALVPLLGDRRLPLGASGAEAWPDLWPLLQPRLTEVLRSGRATRSEDVRVPFDRHGFAEETYWSATHLPLHTADGAVAGVLSIPSETTARVLGERRETALADVAEQAGTARDAEHACRLVIASLQRAFADIPFAAIYLAEPGTARHRDAEATLVAATSPTTEARNARWPVAAALDRGETVVLRDVADRAGALPSGGWHHPPTEGVVAPLEDETGTSPIGALVLTASAGTRLDTETAGFLDQVAERATAVLSAGIAAKALRGRAAELAELDRMRDLAEWRGCLLDALNYGVFVCDGTGAVVEINEAFTALLGYERSELPYRLPYPWWLETDGTTEQHWRRFISSPDAGTSLVTTLRRKDGLRIEVALTTTAFTDPSCGERMTLGAVRDVTAERLDTARESALARLTARLSRAPSIDAVLEEGLAEFAALWQADPVAVTWHMGGASVVGGDSSGAESASGSTTRSTDLTDGVRRHVHEVRQGEPLQVSVVDDRESASRGSTSDVATGAGVLVEYSAGAVVIWLGFPEPRRFDMADRTLFALLSGYLRHAIDRAHDSDEQHTIALTLQRSILGPVQLPPEFAVHYEPAGRPLEIGGDWYDVVWLDERRTGLVVGDCVGHGLSAATVMGQLRSACRALLISSGSPGTALATLDEFADQLPNARCTTVFCGVVDRSAQTLTYSSAGHPPGILCHPGGDVDLLERARALPLALLHRPKRTEATVELHPGSTLLLYTDGLVERRGESIDTGIEQATQATVEGMGSPVGELTEALTERLRPAGGYSDDVALLIYRQPEDAEQAPS